MKQERIEYVILYNGSLIGKRMAVSEKDAINKFRFSEIGKLGMYQEGSARAYNAIPSVVYKLNQLKIKNADSYEQLTLKL